MDTYLLPKRRFSRNSRKTNRKSTKMPLRHPPERPKIGPNRFQEATFSLLNFDLVFGSIFAPFCLPKCLPFGAILPLKTDQKIGPKSDCSKSRSKIAPRPPKTLPRCPPDLPGALPDHPGRPKRLFRSTWPSSFFRKNRKVRARRKKVEKKSRQRSSTVVTRIGRSKTESTFTTVGTQRVAAVVARSALQSAAPSAAWKVVL